MAWQGFRVFAFLGRGFKIWRSLVQILLPGLFLVAPSSTPWPCWVHSKLVSLPPVGIHNSICSILNIWLGFLRRISHRMIQFISTKNVSSYSEYQETHGFVLTMSLPWRHVPTCMLSWTPTKVYDRGKNSGWVWLKIKALLLEMRQIFNSSKFLSHLKLNKDDSQPGNLTAKRLAKSSPSASLPNLLNVWGELRARKIFSLHKEYNHPRNPQDYLEEEVKRLINFPVEETQTITKVSWLIALSSFISK